VAVKFGFKELPGRDEGYLRPRVPVVVEGYARAPLACLLDTGTLHNRFGRHVAEDLSIDLTGGERGRIGVGGLITEGIAVPVVLRLGDAVWQAPVWFCNPWPFEFQVLGQEGFFRFFRVEIRAATYTVECTFEPA